MAAMKATLMALLALGVCLPLGCGKKKPDKQANQPESNPPNQPQAKPKVEPTEATLTPGMVAAKKAYDEGRYAEAVRLYTAELAAEEAKSVPSWVQLSYLNNQLGLALDHAGQYDKALEYYQKSLSIWLKQLGPDHPDVAISYNNIGWVHHSKGDPAQARDYWEKTLAIYEGRGDEGEAQELREKIANLVSEQPND